MSRLIRILLLMMRILFPWVRQFIVWGLKAALAAFVGIFSNLRRTVGAIAEEWWTQARLFRLPSPYDVYLYRIACLVVFGYIVIGWVVLSFLTVWAVGVIF